MTYSGAWLGVIAAAEWAVRRCGGGPDRPLPLYIWGASADADAIFGRGADGLAMLTSATGIGAVLAGIWLTLASMCVALFLLAATNWFWLGMVATGAAGFLMVVNGVTTPILIQYACASEMLGRVL